MRNQLVRNSRGLASRAAVWAAPTRARHYPDWNASLYTVRFILCGSRMAMVMAVDGAAAVLEPGSPLGRDDPEHVREGPGPGPAPLLAGEQAEPNRLPHGILDRRAADTCPRCYL